MPGESSSAANNPPGDQAASGPPELGTMQVSHITAGSAQASAETVDSAHTPRNIDPNVPSPPQRIREYRLLGEVGGGGMGVVYRYVHSRLEKTVAIKLLHPKWLKSHSAIARFDREMKAVGKLEHPHIVRATDAGEVDGIHFLVMEFVDGLDLEKIAQRQGPLRVADACELVRQAALGLAHVEKHGLVHRDLKPNNLMLTTEGTVKILDLGLALLQEDALTGELTSEHTILGTIDYMAPEQAANVHAVDIRADLYALGCTLYRLLAGWPPFSGPEHGTYHAKLVAHAKETTTPLNKVRPEVPKELAALIERLLAKDPKQRIATPSALATQLSAFSHGANLPALLSDAATNRDSSLDCHQGTGPARWPIFTITIAVLGILVALAAISLWPARSYIADFLGLRPVVLSQIPTPLENPPPPDEPRPLGPAVDPPEPGTTVNPELPSPPPDPPAPIAPMPEGMPAQQISVALGKGAPVALEPLAVVDAWRKAGVFAEVTGLGVLQYPKEKATQYAVEFQLQMTEPKSSLLISLGEANDCANLSLEVDEKQQLWARLARQTRRERESERKAARRDFKLVGNHPLTLKIVVGNSQTVFYQGTERKSIVRLAPSCSLQIESDAADTRATITACLLRALTPQEQKDLLLPIPAEP